jgi:uncharacterized membrane protein
MMVVKFHWLYVLSGIIFSSLAQICMKQATQFEVKKSYWIAFIVTSASCYLLSFVAYYFALKFFPISKIAPLMTVGVVLIVVLYGVMTGERVTTQQVIGLLLGVMSIILILS